MIHYFKFSRTAPDPAPARDVYVKRGPGRGWPEECPPLRAANGFGFDVPAAFELTFRRRRDGSWRLLEDHDVVADWTYAPPRPRARAAASCPPLVQKNAWFWDRGQVVPHKITPNVYAAIRNQAKLSTFLYLATDPGELLAMGDVPNLRRPFRVLSALIDADRYPASYPWHVVIELDPRETEVRIAAGEPICRLFAVPRRSYAAREMSLRAFDAFFERGQKWLAENGKGPPGPMMDITGAYRREQRRAKFSVRPR